MPELEEMCSFLLMPDSGLGLNENEPFVTPTDSDEAPRLAESGSIPGDMSAPSGGGSTRGASPPAVASAVPLNPNAVSAKLGAKLAPGLSVSPPPDLPALIAPFELAPAEPASERSMQYSS